MTKRIALLLVGLVTTGVLATAPAQANPVHQAYDTNWPCSAC
jgi:hypothetical protein